MLIIVLTTQMNNRVVSISLITPITSAEQMLSRSDVVQMQCKTSAYIVLFCCHVESTLTVQTSPRLTMNAMSVVMDDVLDFPQWIFALIHAIFLFHFLVPDIYLSM